MGAGICITGSFVLTANFNTPSAPGSNEITSQGSEDIFLVRYLGPGCVTPTIPTLSASPNPVCNGSSTTLSISAGMLNDATDWQWYSGSCGGTSVGTGASITVWPTTTTTYYARGEGGCVVPGACGSLEVTVNTCPIAFSGAIRWEHDDVSGVNNATVNLTGSATGSDLTDINGDFLITTGVVSGNFTLKPVKNSNKFNGVTVADATAIQQHLTGINPITDPNKLVCADVNKSNSISTLDATLLNQALLGNPAANAIFNTSWRFVPSSHTMTNPPWGFPEQRTYTGITLSQANQNFIGMKIGDVTPVYANPANFGAGEPLVWIVQNHLLVAGETITLDFRAGQQDDLAAWQFALQFDPGILEFNGLHPGWQMPLSGEYFGTYRVANGEIRSVWSQAKGAYVSESEPVFQLIFKVLRSGGSLKDILKIQDDILPGKAYNSRLQESAVILHFDSATGTEQPELVTPPPFQLLQNRPNPFDNRTTIAFILPDACPAQLRVLDVNGREIWRKNGTWPAGYNEEPLQLPGISGVLYVELTTPWGTAGRKMLQMGK